MYQPESLLEQVVVMLIEGVLKANQRNYAWSLNYLRRFIKIGMEEEEAREIWSRVHGCATGPKKDFNRMIAYQKGDKDDNRSDDGG